MRVVLCDDDQMFVESLAVVLVARGLTVCSLAVTAEEAEEAVLRHRPEVAVLDPNFTDGDGCAVARSLRTWAPETRLMVLTGAGNLTSLARTLDVTADPGLVLASKMIDIDQILGALDRMARGQAVTNPDRLLGNSLGSRRESDLVERLLTGREGDVLARLVQGQSTSKIAADMGITLNTARTHVQNILNKLGVHSRVEAAALAVRTGLDVGTDH